MVKIPIFDLENGGRLLHEFHFYTGKYNVDFGNNWSMTIAGHFQRKIKIAVITKDVD